MTPHRDALYAATQRRPRPEDVAELVLEALGDRPAVDPRERALLDKAAAHSLRRMGYALSSMAADFARPSSGIAKTATTAASLFGIAAPDAIDAMDPEKMTAFLVEAGKVIAKSHGASSLADKLTKTERRALGLFKTTRWYNKRWRLLCRMEKKMQRLLFNQRRYLFTRVGKSGLAVEIPRADFVEDLGTACFIAYLSARMSLRSTFTNTSQVKAFDEVAEVLLKRCEASATTRWDLIAHVLADARVLARLSDEARGVLLGRWWELLTEMADLLGEIHGKSAFDRSTMIVSPGNDSSTWNQVAGGWNKAREQWISLLHAMGLETVLDAVCPGKVMRLMAADVARWHLATGGGVHPGTKVWAALPPPWDAVRGLAPCGRALVEDACRAAGVKPEDWTGPKTAGAAVAFTPTPELVHGVSVSSPALAETLRRAGVFSGKGTKGPLPAVHVVRDAVGAALHVTPATRITDDTTE